MLVRTIRPVVALVALVMSADAASAQAKKPTVMILATGGTIAGAAATGTQAGYTSRILLALLEKREPADLQKLFMTY